MIIHREDSIKELKAKKKSIEELTKENETQAELIDNLMIDNLGMGTKIEEQEKIINDLIVNSLGGK